MKFTMLGFSQKRAIEFGLDLVDLAILRYFADFRDSEKMVIKNIEGINYYWINYKHLLENLPICKIVSKDSLRRRMKKMENVNLLKHEFVRNKNGCFSFYAIGSEYFSLNDYDNMTTQKSEGYDSKVGRGTTQKSEGYDSKVGTKDYSIKDKSIKEIYIYWNEKNIVKHRKLNKEIERAINKKLKDHTEEEIKETIKNYSEIIGDEKYFFNFKWNLKDFMNRGFDNFIDIDIARSNYIKKDFGGIGNGNAGRSGGETGKNTYKHMEYKGEGTYRNEEIDF